MALFSRKCINPSVRLLLPCPRRIQRGPNGSFAALRKQCLAWTLRRGCSYCRAQSTPWQFPGVSTNPRKEAPDEVSSSARHKGQDNTRYRRLGTDVSVPVSVRHRRSGTQPIRKGHVLVLRRAALSGAAVSVRHHL